jgi:aminomethyltransferase
VDDLLVYRLGSDEFWFVVNASNFDKDFAHIQAEIPGFTGVELLVQDPAEAIIAFQGPQAQSLLNTIWADARPLNTLKTFGVFAGAKIKDLTVDISRTGYTGEDGYEIICTPSDAPKLWDLLLALEGVKPCGLGARDTLRLEAGLPLYGHELSAEISPLMAKLGWSVKLAKSDFIGHEALLHQQQNGTESVVVGLVLEGKNIAREGYDVYLGETVVGQVLSGTLSPTLGHPIATALIQTESLTQSHNLTVKIRQNFIPVQIVKLPFYKRTK